MKNPRSTSRMLELPLPTSEKASDLQTQARLLVQDVRTLKDTLAGILSAMKATEKVSR